MRGRLDARPVTCERRESKGVDEEKKRVGTASREDVEDSAVS